MDVSWFVTISLGVIVLYLLYYLATKNSRYWDSRGVANIYSPPFLGIMFNTLILKKSFAQITSDIYRQLNGERFGGYFQLTNPVVMLRDPELINQILIKDFIHFENRVPNWKQSSDLFSLGVANLCGDEWRTARHKLTPTFTSGKLKMMFEHIDLCGKDLVSHVQDNLDKDINAKEMSLKYVLNVISSVAFGLNINTLKDGNDNEFYRVSSNFFKPSKKLILKIMISMFIPKLRDIFNFNMMDNDVENFFRKLTTDIIKYRESTGTRQNDFLQLMLDQRKKERELLLNGRMSSAQDETEDPDDKVLLEQLKNTPVSSDHLQSGEIFTHDFIAAQTFLFISAGSETTAGVLGFLLYELAVNKECQKRVQQEIDGVLSTSEFNYQAIKKMTYMDQCINESMRCHPIMGAFIRICTKDYKIPGTEVVIDKGTFAIIPVASLHKDPQYFADPEKFDPDRFDDINAIPKGVFFSFGDGPRICIAMRLAILEMKIFLARLLLNYDVVLSEKTQLPLKYFKYTIILNVEGGLWVKFRQRQK